MGRVLSRRLVNPIEPQAVQVNVQIRRRAKTLDECYRAGARLRSFAACLLDEVAGDGALDHRQHQCQQFGVYGEQAAQRYGE